MALGPLQLADLVRHTENHKLKQKWQDLSLNLQHYTVVSRFFQRAKMAIRGGPQLQEQLQVRNTGTFQKTGLYARHTSKVVDHGATVTVPWSASVVHWTYDVEEDAFQSGPETTLRTIRMRMHAMYNDYFEGLEYELWGSGADPTAKPAPCYGLLDWIQKGSTDAFGFNGGDPAAFSNGIGNISVNNVPNWSNGTFRYTQISQNDLMDKLAEACAKCYFEPVHSYEEIVGGKPKYVLYTTYPVLEGFQKALTASNDNLQIDLGKFRGRVLFKGHPVEWVPALTEDASPVQDPTNPIIGIDWSTIDLFHKEGKDKYMLPVVIPEEQPTVRRHYMRSWYNTMCHDRRRNFIGHNQTLAS